MTDLISRQDAIALIEAIPPEWARKGPLAEFAQVSIKQVRETITNMPSAETPDRCETGTEARDLLRHKP